MTEGKSRRQWCTLGMNETHDVSQTVSLCVSRHGSCTVHLSGSIIHCGCGHAGETFSLWCCWPTFLDCANFARLFTFSFNSKQTVEDMCALFRQHGGFTTNGVDALMAKVDGTSVARNGQGGQDGMVLAVGSQGRGTARIHHAGMCQVLHLCGLH